MLDDTEVTVHERDICRDPRAGDVDTRGGKKRIVIGANCDAVVYRIGKTIHCANREQWKQGPKP